MKLSLTPVARIGKRSTVAHVNTGRRSTSGFQKFEVDEYPKSPKGEAIRALRVELGIGLREGCRFLGINPVALSQIETGEAVTDEDGWAALDAGLRAFAASRPAAAPLNSEREALMVDAVRVIEQLATASQKRIEVLESVAARMAAEGKGQKPC